MQILTIAGNVGKDAELRRTQNGDAVAGFTVAVDQGKDKNGNKRDSVWFDCSLWGKRGEALAQYITKGMKVTVSGRPTCREYNGKAYMGVSVDQITLQGGKSSSGDSGGYDGGHQGPPADDLDGEIPF